MIVAPPLPLVRRAYAMDGEYRPICRGVLAGRLHRTGVWYLALTAWLLFTVGQRGWALFPLALRAAVAASTVLQTYASDWLHNRT